MNIISKFKKKFLDDEIFPEAKKLYMKSTYKDDIRTKDDLIKSIVKDIQKNIKYDTRFRGSRIYLNITTYSYERDKLVLPEVAKIFQNLGYHVDLLNSENYSETNVLIITWQKLDPFK